MGQRIFTLTLLLIPAVTLLVTFTNAQTLEWAKRMGGTLFDEGNSIAIDKFGNVYITGSFEGIADINTGNGMSYFTSFGGSDIFVIKLDEFGNFIWARQMGGLSDEIGYSLDVDSSGSVYITGDFINTADFDPGIGIFNLSPPFPGHQIFICKLDPLGNFVWAKQLGGDNWDEGYAIAIDAFGNIYTTGYFEGTGDFDPGIDTFNITSTGGPRDIFVSKLNASGNFLWAKQMGGGPGNAYGYSIVVDFFGNVLVTGLFQTSAEFITDSMTIQLVSAGGYEIYITKLDSLGNILWAKQMGGSLNDRGSSVVVNTSGDVYTTGYFNGVSDFDPGTGTFNLTSTGSYEVFISKLDKWGNFLWAKQIGGPSLDVGNSINLDIFGNIYISGGFYGTSDFDPDSGIYALNSGGTGDIFICKLDSLGNFVWAKHAGGTSIDYGNSISSDVYGNIYTTGYFQGVSNFEYDDNSFVLSSTGSEDIFIHKIRQRGIYGRIYNDISQNCIQDSVELGLTGRKILITPGNIITETNEAGIWIVDSLPAGTYNAIADTSGHWAATCANPQSFTVTNPDDVTPGPSYGFISTQPCTSPEISVFAPALRPCFTNQLIYVQACNQTIATGVLDSAYVVVLLDSLFTVQSATLAYTSIGNNRYRFEVGTLNPGICADFQISFTLSCNAFIGQTLCMQANLYPADSCVFDTIANPTGGGVSPCTTPWDHSSLSVDGYCLNDTIVFIITNTGDPGNGDMSCYAPVRIYIDGQMILLDSIQLAGGDSALFIFSGDGRTWRLEAGQHPLHPGNSHPNATVEACGDTANWIPGLVTALPHDDADPIIDIYCGAVTGSYDPNDKTGDPDGIGINHDIRTDQKIEYVIRFQNTGNDTAFNVIVRDTLDPNLDIFSVVPGASSHPYYFRLYGPGVLEWLFYSIFLPDSNVNEPESHGFVSFSANQKKNLADGTQIINEAAIYFDYNLPVMTNTVLHTVNSNLGVPAWIFSQTITDTACSLYSLNGLTYTSGGTYYQLLPGSGADTILTIQLTINGAIDTSVIVNGDTLISNAYGSFYQWIDCSNNMPVAGAVSQIFVPASNGSYAVSLSQDICADTSGCYAVIIIRGLENINGEKYMLFPNPASGKLVIQLNENFGKADVEITNPFGVILIQKTFVNKNTLDIEMELPPGLYFVMLRCDMKENKVWKVVQE